MGCGEKEGEGEREREGGEEGEAAAAAGAAAEAEAATPAPPLLPPVRIVTSSTKSSLEVLPDASCAASSLATSAAVAGRRGEEPFEIEEGELEDGS